MILTGPCSSLRCPHLEPSAGLVLCWSCEELARGWEMSFLSLLKQVVPDLMASWRMFTASAFWRQNSNQAPEAEIKLSVELVPSRA